MSEAQEHPDWENFWNDDISVHQEVLWKVYEHETMPLIVKHMPRSGEILDAGCGRGGMLIYLSRLGFNVRGCEISKKNISLINKYDPDVSVDEEDVLNMSYEGGRFSGMVSYGVMEHFEPGPAEALKEARRVMRPGGMLFVSVPYTTNFREFRKNLKNNKLLRSLLGKKPRVEQKNVEIELEFTREEFADHLSKAGFEVVESAPVLCKHYVASISSFFRGDRYPEKLTYGDLLEPDLNIYGKLFYSIASVCCPWKVGHFQFFVARAI